MYLTTQQSLPEQNGNNSVLAQDLMKTISYDTLKLGEKIGASPNFNKAGSDLEMIEKFYYRLLPVTYLAWVCNKNDSCNLD